jgi:hypothetical protein
MRRQLILGAALGTALLGVVPITAASAATHSQAQRRPAVLTVNKAGGPAVKRGAVLKAGLAKGASVTFFAPGTSNGVTCKQASFTDKVTKNPPSPGLALEQLTAQTFSKCSVHGVGGATGVKSIHVAGLPYRTTLSGRAGHPIVLFRARTTLTLKTVLGTLTCGYGAAKVKGTASNVGQVNIFKDQTFTKISGSVACPTKGDFSATFGPVKDTSVKGSPHVFVN